MLLKITFPKYQTRIPDTRHLTPRWGQDLEILHRKASWISFIHGYWS